MNYNKATEIVIDWLVKNEPSAQFYSPKENSDINWQTQHIRDWLVKSSISGLNAEEIEDYVRIQLGLSSTTLASLATKSLHQLLENVQWEELVVKEDIT